jgi:thiol-disulfide isomerase/thioredoxin
MYRIISFLIGLFTLTTLGCGEEPVDPNQNLSTHYEDLVNLLYYQVDVSATKEGIAKGDELFGDDQSWLKAKSRLQNDLKVIGMEVPPTLELDWVANKSDELDLHTGTTLVVFWELWCPHCRREVPELENLYQEYSPKGLKMVGLTRMSKKVPRKEVISFLSEKGVSYPIAKTDSTLGRYLSVTGYPSSVLVKDGKVMWKGNPARFPTHKLTEWIGK